MWIYWFKHEPCGTWSTRVPVQSCIRRIIKSWHRNRRRPMFLFPWYLLLSTFPNLYVTHNFKGKIYLDTTRKSAVRGVECCSRDVRVCAIVFKNLFVESSPVWWHRSVQLLLCVLRHFHCVSTKWCSRVDLIIQDFSLLWFCCSVCAVHRQVARLNFVSVEKDNYRCSCNFLLTTEVKVG